MIEEMEETLSLWTGLPTAWGIGKPLLLAAAKIDRQNETLAKRFRFLADRNFLKVLAAFREAGVGESHLQVSHGYGYHDSGRQALDRVFAAVFGGEEALVRPQFVSGTHALRAALFGILRPGDTLVVIPAVPYDTLLPVFGLAASSGSLHEWGVHVEGMELGALLQGEAKLPENAKAVFIQRSKGYRWQDSLNTATLKKLIEKVKANAPHASVIVDNCYGEFVEAVEPCDVGADLAVGSLLKNPGGGICPTGGYVVGKALLVEAAAAALTAPGLGKAVGPLVDGGRDLFRGLFLAPQFVGEALEAAEFGARLFSELGYRVLPEPAVERTDIIQAIELGSREKVLVFAKGIQRAGPIDAGAVPEGALTAGYADAVVMAGGTFVQGGSLELSCDAPIRAPYVVYVQGGLSAFHGKLGYLLAAQALADL